MSDPHQFSRSVVLPTAPDDVFNRLIEPASLRAWFAEDVHVEPHSGGAYAFWGRHTIAVPARDRADQRLTRCVPGERLSYTWTWAGSPTDVDIELTRHDDGTALALRHIFSDGRTGAAGMAGDFWTVALANLDAFVRHGAPALRPDLAQPLGTVVLAIDLDHAPPAVFQGLSEPALLDRWIARAAVVDPRPGGTYSYGWWHGEGDERHRAGPSTALEFEIDRSIVTDWAHEPQSSPTVTWTLEPTPAGTRLHFRHTGVVDADDHADHVQGWSAYLVRLRAVLDEVRRSG